MTQLDNKEAVIDMVTSLSKYYRYTTRAEQQLTKLSSEMDLVVHYLNIQSLQTNRIRYSVDIPEAMMSQPVPKLIVQPIVENAIKHGIEPKKGLWGKCIELVRFGKVNVKDIVTEKASLEDGAALVNAMAEGTWGTVKLMLLHDS